MREYTQQNRLISESEKEKIENTVENVESQTSGEIAVVVSDRSGRYREAEVLGGIFFSGLISLVLTWLFFSRFNLVVYSSCRPFLFTGPCSLF